MKDENKTKKQLINEIKELRNQVVKQTQTDCMEVTQLLQDSEKRFSCLVESASDAILSVNRHGNITSWNRTAEIVFGYTADEIVGKPFVLLVPERFAENSRKAMEQMNSMDKSYFAGKTFERPGLRKDGSEFTAELSYALCETREGLLLTTIVRDITERKRVEEALKEAQRGLEQRVEERTLELRTANEQLKQDVTERRIVEEALRYSEAKYRELVQNANSIILRMDVKGNVTFFNKFAQDFFGYSEGEIIGRNVVGTIVPEIDSSGRDLATMIENIGSQPELYKNNENENVCRNGKRVWVSWTNTSVYDKNENVSETLCIGNDITDRKRGEKELKATKNFLENIFKTSVDGIIVTDHQGCINMVNEATAKILGYSKDELIGKHTVELSPKGNNYEERIKKFTTELFEKGIIGYEHSWLRKDGGLSDCETSVALLKDEQGNVTGAVGSIRDISERKQAEKKLFEYQNRLKSLASQLTLTEEKDRRRFATYLHDQVGQALFISKLKLGTIKEQASSTDTAESLEEIINIIEQTIKETRSLTFELSPPILYQLGLEAALEWLVEQMQEQYGMTIYFEDDKRSKPLDESVLILLFRVVRELLINVTKHAKAQNVKVTTRRYGEKIKIVVEDDGVGFTGPENGSSNHKNDGFGLFSIEERLDSLGGYLEIESEVGRGACVTITAPLNSKKEN